jgi:hypothetical protein
MTSGELKAGSDALRHMLDGQTFWGSPVLSYLGDASHQQQLLDAAAAAVIGAYTKQHAINVAAAAAVVVTPAPADRAPIPPGP